MLVGYARVSSTDQDLSVQIQQLEAAGCEKIFQEKTSGTKALQERPELTRCMHFVREGDTLMVTRLDRFGRSIVHFHALMGELDEKGVAFKCLLQPFDTSTAEGKLLRNILAAFAEFETTIRRERQREGIEEAKARGVYTKHGNRRNPPARLAHASRMLREGMTYKEAAIRSKVKERTLRRRFPGFNERPYTPRGGSTSPEIVHKMDDVTTHPTAAGTAEGYGTPETTARKRGILGSILGR